MRDQRLAVRADALGLTFRVYVQPRSSINRIVGLHGDALKIKIKAPPVDGAANKMCTRYLADCLNLPKSLVEIRSGKSGRMKQVRVCFGAEGNTMRATKTLHTSIQALVPSS